MKRDMELIRKMLFKLEELDTRVGPAGIGIDGYDKKIIDYHSYLLVEAGYAAGTTLKRTSDDDSLPRAYLSHLTWPGHEFINTVRDDNLWKKVTEKVKTGVGSASLEIIKQLASHVSKQILGL